MIRPLSNLFTLAIRLLSYGSANPSLPALMGNIWKAALLLHESMKLLGCGKDSKDKLVYWKILKAKMLYHPYLFDI
jgi:hypothetical protein